MTTSSPLTILQTIPAEALLDAYVCDTHPIIWYLKSDPRLSRTARAIFDRAANGEALVYFSVISLAELYFVNGKFGYFPDIDQLINELLDFPAYRFVALISADIFDFGRDAAVPEMHDRIIAGLARRLGLPLITADPVIRDSGVVTTVW